MIAVILAGGKSSRMGKEKGVIEVRGKKMIDLVVERVRESKAEDFFIATSLNASMTRKYCQIRRYTEIETPGRGYHEDLRYLLQIYPEFVSVACDIPFLRSEHIDAIIDFYAEKSSSSNNSVTGVILRDIIPSPIVPTYVFEYEGRKLVACGLNVVTSSKNSFPFLFNDPLLAININTPYDLEIVNGILRKRIGGVKR
jgi:adenosylcobinamide-phosphate guanylyltransferase